MISVFVDNNAWDILYRRGVDLCTALPSPDFGLAITREAEFEIASIPDQDLLAYIHSSISSRQIPTDTYFGFGTPGLPPGQQRVAGFNQGRFADLTETTILAAEAKRIKPTKRPTGLFKNEADVSLAARSAHSILLTSDKKGLLGQVEAKYGATVVDLSNWPQGLPLGDFVRSHSPKSS